MDLPCAAFPFTVKAVFDAPKRTVFHKLNENTSPLKLYSADSSRTGTDHWFGSGGEPAFNFVRRVF